MIFLLLFFLRFRILGRLLLLYAAKTATIWRNWFGKRHLLNSLGLHMTISLYSTSKHTSWTSIFFLYKAVNAITHTLSHSRMWGRCSVLVPAIVLRSRNYISVCLVPSFLSDKSPAVSTFALSADILPNVISSSVVFPPLLLCIVPSVAWGEDGIDELHVVGCVYQELLVYSANFTYIYATSLSTLYSLCLLYTHIQHIDSNIYIKVYCNVSNKLNAI